MIKAVPTCPVCDNEDIHGGPTFFWCKECLWAGLYSEIKLKYKPLRGDAA